MKEIAYAINRAWQNGRSDCHLEIRPDNISNNGLKAIVIFNDNSSKMRCYFTGTEAVTLTALLLYQDRLDALYKVHLGVELPDDAIEKLQEEFQKELSETLSKVLKKGEEK